MSDFPSTNDIIIIIIICPFGFVYKFIYKSIAIKITAITKMTYFQFNIYFLTRIFEKT